MKKALGLALIGALVVGGLVYRYYPKDYCEWAKDKYGVRLEQCPDGKLRQVVRIRGSGLRRSGPGTVYLSASALYTVAAADSWQGVPIRSFDAKLSLVDSAGKETPVPTKEKWKSDGDERFAEVVIPTVPDGDYLLRAQVKSKVATGTVDLPLALYAPAKIHIITDRPLYEPGNDIQFRALVLRASDLSPIDFRQGVWIVRDPGGQLLLEEKAAAGEWGVVAGNFPLDREAPVGTWSVSWRSGDTEGAATFRVEPFTLPRFRVETTPDKQFYRPGDKPVVAGAVTYSSGAPVAGAKVEINWTVSGAWPPPTEWAQGALPKQATTAANGRFELRLPEIPADLQNQVRLIARIAAVDPAGDRVQSTTALLLSRDAIKVQAITELAGGLVAGFNNRVYLRVTTADGRPLPGATINVKRAWSRTDKGIDAELDEDAVSRVQIDPGPPVNVVIPPAPFRASPQGQVVTRTSAMDLATQEQPNLAEQIEMDKWNASIETCARWADADTNTAKVVMRVNEAGAIVASDAGEAELDACVLAAVRKRRLPRGAPRLFAIEYRVDGSGLPSLTAEIAAPLGVPEGLDELLEAASLDARGCLPRRFEGEVPWRMAWQVRAGSKKPTVSWMKTRGDVKMPAALATCVIGRVARRQLEESAEDDQIGLIDFTVSAADKTRQSRPQATIMQGYELLVSAAVDGKPFGATKLRMSPGSVPPLRLRATPVMAKAGDEVLVELFRGPDFQGEIPKELTIDHLGNQTVEKIDPKKRTATVTLPADAQGWYQLSAGGYHTLIFARSGEELTVAVKSENPTYAPGADAILGIQTTVAGKGAKAAVGLFGVDQSLGQLATLPGADDLRGVRPEIPMSELAFGVLDGQALALGRIRGTNAAEATILRVASVPTPPEVDVVIDGNAESSFDPIAELTDRFYPILAELHAQARLWEQSAPAGEIMTPETMARLWKRALDAAKKRGVSIEDAFGRRLRLHRLPADLLELTDPRQVVVVGTRLPEDVEDWPEWVQKKRP